MLHKIPVAGRYSSASLSLCVGKRINWWRSVGPGSFLGCGLRTERLPRGSMDGELASAAD